MKHISKLQKKINDPNSTLWRNKADKAWKILVHFNYNHRCAICGSQSYVQAHHLIPREMTSHRHIIENGIVLCSSHHKYSFELSPHKAPIEFAKWLMNNDYTKWTWLLTQKPSKNHEITFQEVSLVLGEEYAKRLEEQKTVAKTIS